MNLKRTLLLIGLSLVTSVASPAIAQDFPSKAIDFIVPYPPGGGTDTAARVLADAMEKILGSQVVVLNQPGASGNIGSSAAAKAAADGYTIVMLPQNNAASNLYLYKNPGYHPIDDLDPVSLIATVPVMLVVRPSLPVNSVEELIALAKSEPGKLNYASSSIGGSPHMAMELLRIEAGLDMVHLPYPGSAPAKTALLGGHVDLMFDNIPSVLPQVESGLLRSLGVSGSSRSPAAPDVPTVAEAGLPGFELQGWYGVFVPEGTPADRIEKLNSVLDEALAQPDVKKNLENLGYEIVGGPVETLAKRQADDMEKFKEIIESTGMSVED